MEKVYRYQLLFVCDDDNNSIVFVGTTYTNVMSLVSDCMDKVPNSEHYTLQSIVYEPLNSKKDEQKTSTSQELQ